MIPGEKYRYTVRARDERFIIITKRTGPYVPGQKMMYWIIDLNEGVRGKDNHQYGMFYETDRNCQFCLRMLRAGLIGLKKTVPLDIEIE